MWLISGLSSFLLKWRWVAAELGGARLVFHLILHSSWLCLGSPLTFSSLSVLRLPELWIPRSTYQMGHLLQHLWRQLILLVGLEEYAFIPWKAMACHSGHQLGPHQSKPSSLAWAFCGFLVWLLFTFTPLPLESGIREKWLLRPSIFTHSEHEGWLRALGSILTAVELPHKCEA